MSSNDIYAILSSVPHNPHYLKRYIGFIESCQTTDNGVDGYTERHHICPKSLFPDYENLTNHHWNMSILTPRQHFIAHWILSLAYGGDMVVAYYLMIHGKYNNTYHVSSRQYERAKLEYLTHFRDHIINLPNFGMRGKIHSDKTKAKLKNAWKNRGPVSQETRMKQSSSRKDVPLDNTDYLFKHRTSGDEFRGNQLQFREYSGLTKQESYNLTSGRVRHSKGWGIFNENEQIFSFEIKSSRDKSNPSYKKVVCEHCKKSISIGNYKRWHGNNCKMIDPEGHTNRTLQVSSINRSS